MIGTVVDRNATRYDRAVASTAKECRLCAGAIVRERDEWSTKYADRITIDEEDGYEIIEPGTPDRPSCLRCENTGIQYESLLRCPACHGTGDAKDAPDPKCKGCGGSGVATLNLTAEMKRQIAEGFEDLAERIRTGSVVMRSLLVIDESKRTADDKPMNGSVLIEWAGVSMFPAPPTQKRFELAERLAEQMMTLSSKLAKDVAK